MIHGTTYSHVYAKQLGLDLQESFQQALDFKFDIIRLCCYWNEIQPTQESFDISAIEKLLQKCEEQQQKVILSIGMKAPRWPEFYIPQWIKSKDPQVAFPYTLQYIEKLVSILKHFSCITYWQVENEPMDPQWPENTVITFDMLKQEVDLVRQLDPTRKIMINLWGNHLTHRGLFPKIEQLADVIGLDIYYNQAITKNIFGKIIKTYTGPNDSDKTIKNIIQRSSKPVFIAELQAEPWEHDIVIPKIKNPKSMNESLLRDNYARARALGVTGILFWGFEYWLWKKAHLSDDLLICGKQIMS